MKIFFLLLGLAAFAASDNVQGLLCKEKAAIKRTWALVNQDLPQLGRDTFLAIFSYQPKYKDLFLEFRNVPAAELANSERLLYHAGRVVSAINFVVNNIDNPAAAGARLVELGENHITRGTVRIHFEVFSAAFIDQIKQRGGDAVTAADLAAWRKGWNLIIDILEAGLLKRSFKPELTDLSCEDVANVQDSWAVLSGDLKETGASLFKRLFDTHPEYQQLFRQFRDVPLAELQTNNGFVAHVYKVIAAFDGLIRELDNNAWVVATLKRLGEQHITRKTDLSHFQSFRKVLIAVMKENGLTAAQEASWAKAFIAIEKYISVGLDKLKVVDPITGLSGLEKTAVLGAWSKVRGNLQAVGKAVFGKLFSKNPQYQQMFRFFQGITLAELVESPKFAAHTQRVVSALDQTFLALNRPADFVYMIKELGLDHINRGTDKSHFENFQVAFIEYLKETLGGELSEFDVQSFNHVIEVVINFLDQSLKQADIVDPVTHLTGRQKAIIKEQWTAARVDLRALGIDLFVRLLKVRPDYQALFVNKGFAEVPIDQLAEDERFATHITNVLQGFDTLMQNLDDTSYFVYALRNLGDAHIKRKAGAEHFRAFEAILIQYLQETQAIDADAVTAWSKLFDVMIGVIKQGLKVTTADEADPVTGMTGAEVSALRAAFFAFGPQQKEVGKVVFAKLFAAHPEYKNLFKAFAPFSLAELPSTPVFDSHIGKVMARFAGVGKVLDDNVSFVYLLKKLGREHIRRGLSRKQFDEFVALYIEEISPRLNDAAKSGLKKALDFAVGVIEQGLFQLGQVDSKALTALEKQVIRDVWATMTQGGLDQVAVTIFNQVFAAKPEYKVLFTRFGDVSDVAANPAFKAHVHRVMSAFDVVLQNLDNTASLVRQLQELGQFHTRLGMTRAHFEAFGAVFVQVAKQLAPAQMNALGVESVEKGLAIMISVIEEGLLQLQRVDPLTGLSAREVVIVKQTWALVKPDLMGIGMRVFKSLFVNFPQYQAVFKKFSDVPVNQLADVPAVGKHAIAVTTKLDELIQTLDNPANLALIARSLGEDHIVLGVSKSMFKNFAKVTIKLLENDLGERFSSFAVQSWKKALNVVIDFIEEGLEQSWKQDPVTGLTSNEKALIQESWGLLKPDLLGFGQKLFGLIFFRNPEYQALFARVGFGATPLADLKGNPKFAAHIIKVIGALDSVVADLEKPRTLKAVLKQVGADHIARNVERRHFQAFSEALIAMLKQELKEKLSAEATAAWRKGLDRIIGIVDQGLLGLQEVNPQSAFSAADVREIQATWAMLKPNLIGKGAAVFRRMFTDHSEYQALFSNLAGYKVTALEGSPELNAHAANVMGQLDDLVSNLQNSISLGKTLRALGKDHVARRVNVKHFQDFAEDFIALLRTDLGEELTPLAESAWKKAFDVMIATIEQGQRSRRSIATFLLHRGA